MPSWTSIANRALGALSEKRIQSYTSTTEKGAIEFRNVYQEVTDEVLASHPWNCAIQRITIDSADATAPTWGFTKSFTLPADPRVLRVWKLSEEFHDGDTFRVIGRKIHTDAGAPLRVEAICRVDDPMDFSPLLAKAISASIAEAIAIAMTDSSSRRDEMAGWAERCLQDARFADGQEGSPEDVEASEFEAERY